MNKPIVLALSVSLAVVFTFSCSSNSNDDDTNISSSSVVETSSSSSSNIELSSSSIDSQSSSSADILSSSSVSSSSVIELPSSSSAEEVSSSSVGLCDGFVDGTKREHYGKMKEQFCDVRDGKKYVYVKIDEQIWMAENLNYDVEGSNCYTVNPFIDNTTRDFCADYGRLYSWATAMGFASDCNNSSCASQILPKHTGVCPSGWHIPSNAEWETLITALGDYLTLGKRLKTTSGWEDYPGAGNGLDTYGFSALPGGYHSMVFSSSVGYLGYWHSASESPDSGSCAGGLCSESREIANYDEKLQGQGWFKNYGYSLRCVKD